MDSKFREKISFKIGNLRSTAKLCKTELLLLCSHIIWKFVIFSNWKDLLKPFFLNLKKFWTYLQGSKTLLFKKDFFNLSFNVYTTEPHGKVIFLFFSMLQRNENWYPMVQDKFNISSSEKGKKKGTRKNFKDMEHRFPEVWQWLKCEDRYMQEHE